jgi:hypothetical protein
MGSRIRQPKRPRLPRPLEKQLARAGVDFLRLRGVVVRRRNTGGRHWRKKDGTIGYVQFNETGACDYWFIYKGRHCEMECKRPGERPKKHQLIYMKTVNLEGGFAFWTDSDRILERSIWPALVAGLDIVIHDNGDYDFVDPGGPVPCAAARSSV